jgi:hypothetical protein
MIHCSLAFELIYCTVVAAAVVVVLDESGSLARDSAVDVHCSMDDRH